MLTINEKFYNRNHKSADGYILQVYRIPHGKNDANHLGRTGFCSVTKLCSTLVQPHGL